LDRNLRIFELANQKKSRKEIMRIINDESLNGSIIGYSEVSIALKRIKNKIDNT